jgi:hypothetical protein
LIITTTWEAKVLMWRNTYMSNDRMDKEILEAPHFLIQHHSAAHRHHQRQCDVDF